MTFRLIAVALIGGSLALLAFLTALRMAAYDLENLSTALHRAAEARAGGRTLTD